MANRNWDHLTTEYDDRGFTIAREVLDGALMAEAQEHLAWLIARHPDRRPENLSHELATVDPFWIRLVGDERLLDVAEAFLGPDIALFASHYLVKPPKDGQPVLWHQDGSYWPLDPMEVVTLWLAVDDSTRENGYMRVIPGTHRVDLKETRESSEVPNVLLSEIAPEHVDDSAAVDVELAAGDVSIHHPNIIHGSLANNSERRRAGLTIRYIPTSTRITSKEAVIRPILLRGEARSGINSYISKPQFDKSKHFAFTGCK